MDNLPPNLLKTALNFPAAIPPAGIRANFENPPSLSGPGYVDLTLCLVISAIFFSIRVYTKAYVMRQFHLEDYIFILAFLFDTVLIGICYNITHKGLYHQWDLKVKDTIFYLYWYRMTVIIFCIAICLIKVAILLQILRIFCVKGQRNIIFWFSHIMIWITIGYNVAAMFVEIFPCRPISHAWDPILVSFPDGSCVNVDSNRVVATTLNVITDLAILIIPHHIIWKLQLSTKRKIGLSAIFAIGFLACAISVVRLYYTIKLLNFSFGDDEIRSATYVGFFLFPEVVCGILIATLPVMPRFYQSMRESHVGSSIYTLVFSGERSTSASPESETQASSKNGRHRTIGSSEKKGSRDIRYEVNNRNSRNQVFWRSFGSENTSMHEQGSPRTTEEPSTWYDSSIEEGNRAVSLGDDRIEATTYQSESDIGHWH